MQVKEVIGGLARELSVEVGEEVGGRMERVAWVEEG